MILNHTLSWCWDKRGTRKGGGIDFCGFTVRRKYLEFWLQDLLLADPRGYPPLCLWEEKRLFPVSGILFIPLDPKLLDKCGKRQFHKRWNWEWRHSPCCSGGWTIQAPEGCLFQALGTARAGAPMLPSSAEMPHCHCCDLWWLWGIPGMLFEVTSIPSIPSEFSL